MAIQDGLTIFQWYLVAGLMSTAVLHQTGRVLGFVMMLAVP